MFKLIKIVCGLLVLLVLVDSVAAQNTPTTSSTTSALAQKLNKAALDRLLANVTYDPAYVSIKYPMGDVPAHMGVCSDVIIRSYRKLGLDLQELVHKDMRRAFGKYPKRWGLKRPYKNIDHRRVANLRVFLTRHGKVLKISNKAADYKTGDLVTWDLAGTKPSSLIHTKLPHIGIVTDRRSATGARPLIVHNIGRGPKLEDILFQYKITGHYRYLPQNQ